MAGRMLFRCHLEFDASELNEVLSNFIELAQSVSPHGDGSLQEILNDLKYERGDLTSKRLLDVAKVARILQIPDSGLLLFRWIDQRLQTSRETDNELMEAWRTICAIYSDESVVFRHEDGEIAAAPRVSCGLVEARFLELEAQYVKNEKVSIVECHGEMMSILQRTFDEHTEVRFALDLSKKIEPVGYDTLNIHTAAEHAQPFSSSIPGMDYQSYNIFTHECTKLNVPTWHSLGCLFTDASEFVAESSVAKSERWQIDCYHPTDHPYSLLRLAVCCFGQGSGFKLSMYCTWYCERLSNDETVDQDKRCLEIGRQLKCMAMETLDAGRSAEAQEGHSLGFLVDARQQLTDDTRGGEVPFPL